jgi:hypothetical protein
MSFPNGVLVALLDGLGHGPEAAAACVEAVPILEAHGGDTVDVLVRRCHEQLRGTRGAVMSLASFRAENSMSWIAVGNVGAILLRKRRGPEVRNEAIVARGGVVGYQLPPLRTETVPVFSGDTLIMTTDGVRDVFSDGIRMDDSPQEIAESVLARFAKGSDDAHVVVARYVGARP